MLCEPPPVDAVIVTEVDAVTEDEALIVKDAFIEPAGTVTLAGTEQAVGLLLERATTVSDGAASLRVTVPI